MPNVASRLSDSGRSVVSILADKKKKMINFDLGEAMEILEITGISRAWIIYQQNDIRKKDMAGLCSQHSQVSDRPAVYMYFIMNCISFRGCRFYEFNSNKICNLIWLFQFNIKVML
jgi:hypothetical protein